MGTGVAEVVSTYPCIELYSVFRSGLHVTSSYSKSKITNPFDFVVSSDFFKNF